MRVDKPTCLAHNGFVKLTLKEIRQRVTCEADAYKVMEELRWPNGPICSHCGHDKAYFLVPKNGLSRATGPARTMSQRRVWKCAKCRRQFSVLTGTIFQGTKVSVEVWLMVMVQMCSAKNGISAREVERMHGVTPETAWFILHRLREAMKREPLASALMTGTVVADETYYGGRLANQHRQGQTPRDPYRLKGKSTDNKTPVVALVNAETGEVRARVVPTVNGDTLRRVLTEETEMRSTTLHTDALKSYRPIGRDMAGHEWVDHSSYEYVRNGVSTNLAESYFAQMKRSIDGTHHAVSRKHLPRYVEEWSFRWNTRQLSDGERLQKMVDQAQGRRLTYRPLKGNG